MWPTFGNKTNFTSFVSVERFLWRETAGEAEPQQLHWRPRCCVKEKTCAGQWYAAPETDPLCLESRPANSQSSRDSPPVSGTAASHTTTTVVCPAGFQQQPGSCLALARSLWISLRFNEMPPGSGAGLKPLSHHLSTPSALSQGFWDELVSSEGEKMKLDVFLFLHSIHKAVVHPPVKSSIHLDSAARLILGASIR